MTSTPGSPADTGRTRRTIVRAFLVLVVGVAAVAGAGYFVLWAFNPVGDEYVCSEGEVPGGQAPVAPGEGNDCYTPGELPDGVEADPFGNRPMSYNCDKDGFRLVVKTDGRGAGEVTECIADETEIPSGWALDEEE